MHLKILSERENVITKADKGGAVVIINTDNFAKDANQQLDNSECYKKLPNIQQK